MLATVALLSCLGARWPWPQTWMLACALVVARDPWALLQAGFWLSSVAVGVLFATDAGSAQGEARELAASGEAEEGDAAANTASRWPSSPAAWLRTFFADLSYLIREQWVVTVALAPLTLLLFGQVSLVGLLANTFAIPWVTLVVTPLAMLGVGLPRR